MTKLCRLFPLILIGLPALSAELPRGAAYVFDPFDGPPKILPFENLLAVDRLDGSVVKVFRGDTTLDASLDNSLPAGTEAGRFVFAQGSVEAEMANVYYWIDRGYNWYRDTLDFPELPTAFYAVVRAEGSENGISAAYLGRKRPQGADETRPTLAFSGPSGNKHSPALAADVILHEFHHWATDEITHMTEGLETTALHEGYSDYFAVHETQHVEFGRYVAGQTLGSALRDLGTTTAFEKSLTFPLPAKQQDSYFLGEVFAQALLEVETRLCENYGSETGRDIAVHIVHYSRFFLDKDTTDIREGFAAMLDADKEYYDGHYGALINEVFRKRGFQLEQEPKPSPPKEPSRSKGGCGILEGARPQVTTPGGGLIALVCAIAIGLMGTRRSIQRRDRKKKPQRRRSKKL